MIEEKNGGASNERELFHGTRKTMPRDIYESEEGFDMRFSAEGMWGPGPITSQLMLATQTIMLTAILLQGQREMFSS